MDSENTELNGDEYSIEDSNQESVPEDVELDGELKKTNTRIRGRSKTFLTYGCFPLVQSPISLMN